MTRPDDIVAYTYKAEIYAPERLLDAMANGGTIEAAHPELSRVAEQDGIEGALDLIAEVQGIDREDERSFDSGDFPKVVFRDQYEDYKLTHEQEN